MRYAVAIIVAGLIIAGGTGFVWHTHRGLEMLIRQGIKDGQAAGRVPRGIDPDEAVLIYRDFEGTLPVTLQLRLTLAELLTRWRLVLVLIVALTSLGVARLLGRWWA